MEDEDGSEREGMLEGWRLWWLSCVLVNDMSYSDRFLRKSITKLYCCRKRQDRGMKNGQVFWKKCPSNHLPFINSIADCLGTLCLICIYLQVF